MNKKFIIYSIILFMLSIVSTSAYIIDGDSVYEENSFMKISVSPHTKTSPFIPQILKLESKDTPGDICVAGVFPKTTRYLRTDKSQYFNRLVRQDDIVYYTEEPFYMNTFSDKDMQIWYDTLSGTSGKFDIIALAPRPGYDCIEAYQDVANRYFIITLDPWWDNDWESCRNLTIRQHNESLQEVPIMINIKDTTDMTESGIRFIGAPCDEGGSILNYDVEQWFSNNATVWIQGNISDSVDTVYSLYFNETTPKSAANSTRTTWTLSNKSVWHLNGLGDSRIENNLENTNCVNTSSIIARGYDCDDVGNQFLSTPTSGDNNLYSFGDGAGNDYPFSGCLWYDPVGNPDTSSDQIFNKFDIGSSREWWLAVLQSPMNTLRITLSDAGGGNAIYQDTGSGAIGTGFHHICFTYDGSKNKEGLEMFVNGQHLAVSSVSGATYPGMSNTSVRVSINRRTGDSTNDGDGTYDEVAIYQDVLTDGYINFTYSNIVEHDNIISFAPVQEQPSEVQANTSIKALELGPMTDTSLTTSGVWVEVLRDEITVTGTDEANFLGSFNIEKLTVPGQTNTIDFRLDIDDTPFYTETIRTVSGLEVGVAGPQPFPFNLTGTQNVSILFKKEGSGNVLIASGDSVLLFDESGNNSDIRTDFTTPIFDSSSTSFNKDFTWLMQKQVDSDSYIIVKSTLNASGTSTVDFSINDTEGDSSPIFTRWMSDSSDIGSIMGIHLDLELVSGAHNHSVEGRVSANTVTSNATIFDFDMADADSRPIASNSTSNISTDRDNFLDLGPGTFKLTYGDLTVEPSNAVYISAMVSMGTTTGTQRPEFFINSTISDCTISKNRTLQSSNDIGNVFMFGVCNATSAVETFELWATMDTGETIRLYDENLLVMNADPVPKIQQNIAPIFITQPLDQNISRNTYFSASGTWFDPNGDDTDLSSNCSFLNTSTNNVTDSWFYNGQLNTTILNYCLLTITDEGGLSSNSDTFTLNFIDDEPTFNETIINDTLSINATTNDTYNFNGTLGDINQDFLTLSTNCSFLNITNNFDYTYNIFWQPSYPSNLGTWYCILNVTDDVSTVNSNSFSITVNNVSTPPPTPPAPGFGSNYAMGYMGCEADTIHGSILVVGMTALMIVLFVSQFFIQSTLFSILFGIFLAFYGFSITNCFFLAEWLFIVLAVVSWGFGFFIIWE